MNYFTQDIESVFGTIETYDSIVIFGHKNPDGDCVGSVLGLKHALMELFPDKKIYGVGTRPSYIADFVEPADEVDDETIHNSLSVMVDLSDYDRVEDQRFSQGRDLVCIDHHIASSDFPHPIVRDVDAPSATFVIAKCLLERYGRIPSTSATWLYLGLTTDGGRFQYDSEPETFRIAALMIQAGVDYKKLYNNLYRKTSKDLKYQSYIYSHFSFDGLVTYAFVPREAYLALGLTEMDAGCQVNLLAYLDNHPMWVLFTELESGLIRVELRSNGSYNVQKVATQFGGGGHIPASGCRITSFDKAKEVIAAMNKAEKVEH